MYAIMTLSSATIPLAYRGKIVQTRALGVVAEVADMENISDRRYECIRRYALRVH